MIVVIVITIIIIISSSIIIIIIIIIISRQGRIIAKSWLAKFPRPIIIIIIVYIVYIYIYICFSRHLAPSRKDRPRVNMIGVNMVLALYHRIYSPCLNLMISARTTFTPTMFPRRRKDAPRRAPARTWQYGRFS